MPNWSSNASREMAPPGRSLVRRHTRRIFNLCYRFTGNGTEAEDLTQEVFLRVYRTIGSYRSAHGGFATWMTSVTRNLLIDHYRRTKRDRITDSLDDAMPVVENKQTSARRPDELALLGELSRQVQTALDQAVAGIAGGGCLARLAATRLCGDSAGTGSAGRNCKVPDQPGPHRVGKDFAADGSRAGRKCIMRVKSRRAMQMANAAAKKDFEKLVGSRL